MARRSLPRKVTYFEPVPPRLARNTIIESTFEVGRNLFPSTEATLITDLIRQDLPYYDAAISPAMVRSMTQFSRDVGILQGDPSYHDVVAAPAAHPSG